MTLNDWKNLLLGAGSVLELIPADEPPMADLLVRARARRQERARRLSAASRLRRSSLPFPPDISERVAERAATGIEQLIDQHPQRDLIRKRTGRLQFVVLETEARTNAEVTGGCERS